LIDQTLASYPAALTMQAHTDYYLGATSSWFSGVLSYAQSKGIPIWTATHWLQFTQARHDASEDQYSWNSATNQLTYRFNSAVTEPAITLLAPATHLSANVTGVTVDGVAKSFSSLTVKGFAYDAFGVTSGTHIIVVTYAHP
jgi:hypothetical protein